MNSLGLLDIFAIAWFAICYIGYTLFAHYGPYSSNSLMSKMHFMRLAWMHQMVLRENRMVDVNILQKISSGNPFFASTAVIVIGGLAASLPSGSVAIALAHSIPFARPASLTLWYLQILLMIALFIISFFKFAWAYRLSHYAAIMLGATQKLSKDNYETCRRQSEKAAILSSLSAVHSNAGFRAYYFSLSAIGWIIHPVLFLLSSTLVVVVLYRREFRSNTVKIVSECLTQEDRGQIFSDGKHAPGFD